MTSRPLGPPMLVSTGAASHSKSGRKLGETRLRMIIAIDGPAASGKGTIARRIAAHYRLWIRRA